MFKLSFNMMVLNSWDQSEIAHFFEILHFKKQPCSCRFYLKTHLESINIAALQLGWVIQVIWIIWVTFCPGLTQAYLYLVAMCIENFSKKIDTL